jgi:hypothetical protein
MAIPVTNPLVEPKDKLNGDVATELSQRVPSKPNHLKDLRTM